MGTIRRRVEKSAEATLNLDEMQFLKVKSLISEDVEAKDEQEMAAADGRIWDDLAKDVRRGMWRLLKGLGKTTDADKKFFEACAQRVQEATAPRQEVQKQAQEEKKA
jgi:hypothetical protein